MADTKILIQKQIDQIKELKGLASSEDPKFKSWQQLTKSIIINRLGGKRWQEFQISCSFWPNRMGPWYPEELQESLKEGLDSAESFLATLIQEIDVLGIDYSINQEDGERKNNNPISIPRKFENITVHGGTVVFGDGNKITQVAVRDLVEALSKEIEEKIPNSENKRSVLEKLKEITTNETFASVTGTLLGELLKRIS